MNYFETTFLFLGQTPVIGILYNRICTPGLHKMNQIFGNLIANPGLPKFQKIKNFYFVPYAQSLNTLIE